MWQAHCLQTQSAAKCQNKIIHGNRLLTWKSINLTNYQLYVWQHSAHLFSFYVLFPSTYNHKTMQCVWNNTISVYWDLGGGNGDQVRSDGERSRQDHSILQPHDQLHWCYPHLLWQNPRHLRARIQGPRFIVSICMPRTVHLTISLQVQNQVLICPEIGSRPSICLLSTTSSQPTNI